MSGNERPRVLVTGATGYIGGRLAPRLLDAGYAVRCLARSPRKLADRSWISHPSVEVVENDLADEDALTAAIRGCGPCYYLIHSMEAAGRGYAARDRELAIRFARAAARAGATRIVYLGGLGEMGEHLSEHLMSRKEVEVALGSGPVPVTCLRAAMIIGSGSASFEILRYLVEHLPVMITPRWVTTECQPIAVRDVLHYLVKCIEVRETAGLTLDIGGPVAVTYRDLMRIMAEVRGLPRRLILPVPVLTPRLSSYWIHLVTPVGHRIARPLAEGLRNRVVVRDDRAQRLMPTSLLSVREAIELALGKVSEQEVETVWSAAGPIPGDPGWAGGTVFTDRREVLIEAPAAEVFRAVCRLGGENGWYSAQALWAIRGWMDRLVGGPGLRRGRRDPEEISFGEPLDFWRVVEVVHDRCLVLRAEMKLPGEALLSFDVREGSRGSSSSLVQTAKFLPKGLLGLLYWYVVLPFHHIVFEGMLQGIRKEAETHARRSLPPQGQAAPLA